MIWTLSRLTSLLSENGVDLSKWGKGEAKTIHHLLKELIKEECEIVIKEGKVIRIVHALSITVIYRSEVLKEKYQIFKDGRKRRRRMDCSVAEKLHPSEISDLNSAVKRGLKEELQINDISTDQIHEFPQIHRTRASGSYPDTSMDMVLYKFTVELKDSQYKEEGYIENQEDKDTYFTWIKRDNLRGSGWVNEKKDILGNPSDLDFSNSPHNLKRVIKIGNELKDIIYILTDIPGVKVTLKSIYQHDVGFFILIEIWKYNESRKFHLRIIDDLKESDEYKEFIDRITDIANQSGYHIHISKNDFYIVICSSDLSYNGVPSDQANLSRVLNTSVASSITDII